MENDKKGGSKQKYEWNGENCKNGTVHSENTKRGEEKKQVGWGGKKKMNDEHQSIRSGCMICKRQKKKGYAQKV